MKKYLLALAILIVALNHNSYAGAVAISDAQHVAVNFFKVTNPSLNTALTATLKYTKAEADGRVDFYVFDIAPANGFVIVAADDNVIPVLAYSNESHFRTDFAHTGLNSWVHKTSANISLALQHNVAADARIQSLWAAYRQGQNPAVLRSTTVSPLCSTTWDQEGSNTPPFLYNLLCPFNSTDNQRALTGCVATAMAQIMKFWNYPAVGAGSFTYTDNTAHGYTNNYGTISSDFAAHAYQWSQMPVILNGSTTLTQDSAVDLLMYDCAVSVGMDFGDDNQNGSGANGLLAEELVYGDSFCSQYAFVKYFAYDGDTISGVFESSYTASTWTALIEHDLDMGRPILYEGNDPSQGGHAWVCDGYDANNMLHMNWGWSGSSDGYFAINNLTTPGNFNPIDSDDALIGIVPKYRQTTGINPVSADISFSMYPNPATNEVALKTTIIGSIWSIRNMLGQTLVSKTADTEQTNINLSGFEDGIYLVELHIGDKSIVKKLVISK